MRIIFQITLLLALANCSLDISIDDLKGNDFLQSSILSSTKGLSNGVTAAVVALELKNSDGSLVINYTPEFDFTDDNGITTYSCTESNSKGISTCTIKSIISGVKTIAFNNIDVDVSGDVIFDIPPNNGTFMQVVSAGQVNQDASGYKITSHLGATSSVLEHNVSGYIINTSTTQGLTPTQ